MSVRPGTPDDVDHPSVARVFFREVKPFAVVERLDQLHGPDGGMVGLPHSVLWAPGGDQVDLDEPGGTALAYQSTLAEGRIEDLERVLNRRRLIRVWSQLMLPSRLRVLWEARFPELAASTAGDRSR